MCSSDLVWIIVAVMSIMLDGGNMAITIDASSTQAVLLSDANTDTSDTPPTPIQEDAAPPQNTAEQGAAAGVLAATNLPEQTVANGHRLLVVLRQQAVGKVNQQPRRHAVLFFQQSVGIGSSSGARAAASSRATFARAR